MYGVKTTITILLDPEQRKTTVRHVGVKTPIVCTWGASPHTLAGAYRDAAAYLLDLAGQIKGQPERLTDQSTIMLAEHKPIF